jgi:tetratricopeptide (TPR) repeat protein
MTVGLPGAGIGGLFYLLSALAMPFRAAGESLLIASGRRSPTARSKPRWSLVWKQFAMASGIIAALWVTGWILAAFLVSHPTALGQAQTTEIGRRLPNVLRAAAVLVSLATLGAVLLSVQIARLVVSATARRERRESAPVIRIAAMLLVMIAAPSAASQTVEPNRADPAGHLSMADQAFSDEDTATARREYEAALAANPGASRAMYRLGQLSRSDPRKAESFFRQYVTAEPADAWGWIALGNSLAAQKRYGDAAAAFDRAYVIAPRERDVIIGRARVLAMWGHTDQSIAAYESWTSVNASDAEAQRELGVQRRRAGRYREAERAFRVSNEIEPAERTSHASAAARAFTAPAVELSSGGSRDSEQNQSARAAGALSVQVSDRTRLQAFGGMRWLSGFSDATVIDAGVGLFTRPLAAFRFEATAGLARPHSSFTVTDTIPAPDPIPLPGTGNGNGRGRGNGRNNGGGTPPPGTIIQTESESADNVIVGSLRGVLRKPGGRSSLDLRATRALLDATPVLVINRVVRSEAAGRGDLEVFRRVKLRGGARAGSYSATGDDNTRVSLLGGLVVAATDAIEVSGVFQRLTFSHATRSGYFAPQLAQLAELGTYSEFEWESGTVLAIDAGAGVQRIQEFEAGISGWEPSYRLFASLDIPFRPASTVHFELDSYDSRLGSDAPSTSASWRSFSFSAAVRLALR